MVCSMNEWLCACHTITSYWVRASVSSVVGWPWTSQLSVIVSDSQPTACWFKKKTKKKSIYIYIYIWLGGKECRCGRLQKEKTNQSWAIIVAIDIDSNVARGEQKVRFLCRVTRAEWKNWLLENKQRRVKREYKEVETSPKCVDNWNVELSDIMGNSKIRIAKTWDKKVQV